MTKENEEKVDVEPEEIEDIEEVQDEDGNDITDWKGQAEKGLGMAKRFKTKVQKLQEELENYKKANPPKEPEKPDQSQDKKEFGYAEKAYLRAEGIEAKHFPFVKEAMEDTGKSIEDILASKYFQAELKERREADATEEAIPEGTKRGGTAARDTVDYWLKKGELPPYDQTELRRKVVNERIKQEGEGSKFTDRPVAQA